MTNNVIDLAAQFGTNKDIARALVRMQNIGEVANDLLPVLSQLPHDQQMFLGQLLLWRVNGGFIFPAREMIGELPLLHKMAWGNIVRAAEFLAAGEVIEVVPIKGPAGIEDAVGFIWPALERLMTGMEHKRVEPAVKIAGLDGNPLTR